MPLQGPVPKATFVAGVSQEWVVIVKNIFVTKKLFAFYFQV